RRNLKLSPRFYGPFEIIQKVGNVVYKLNLSVEARIHLVFHVSCLKKMIGSTIQVQPLLPHMKEEEDAILSKPQVVVDRRTRRWHEEILIHWQGLSPSYATWEDLKEIKARF
ncbi:Chromo domain-containing protein, partial [Cephalotus follicularis]